MTHDPCPTCHQRADQVASLAHTAATRRHDVETATAAAEQQAIEVRALRAANARLVADLVECRADRDTILSTLGARIEAARAAYLAEIRALRERVRRLTTAIRGECEHPDTTRWRERARMLSLEIESWRKWTRFNSSAFGALREQRDRYRRVVEDGVAELARSWRAT